MKKFVYLLLISVSFYFGCTNEKNRVKLDYTVVLMEDSTFYMKSEETREYSYSIEVPPFVGEKALLRIGVYQAADDSGDKGLDYALYDSGNKILKAENIHSTGWEYIVIEVSSPSKYTFKIKDLDTQFDGISPGNGGLVRVLLSPVKK